MDCRWIKGRDGAPIALLIPKSYRGDKHNFLTGHESSLQLGVSSYKRGSEVEPHRHNKVERVITSSMEFILVRKGRMNVLLFDDAGGEISTFEMHDGDSILLVAGGHGMTFPEDCELLEVKQGPYVSRTQDKTSLSSSMGGVRP